MFYHPSIELVKRNVKIYRMTGTDTYVNMIHKNGSTTIQKLAGMYGNNMQPVYLEELTTPGKLITFLRDPVDRYWTGTATATPADHMTREGQWRKLVKENIFSDLHVMPQYFFMLNVGRFLTDDWELEFHDVKDINEVFGVEIIHANKRDLDLKDKARDILVSMRADWEDRLRKIHYYPDQIMCNEFIGKTITWGEFKARFEQEQDFFAKYTF